MINLEDIGYFLFMQEQEEEADNNNNDEQEEDYSGEQTAYNTLTE